MPSSMALRSSRSPPSQVKPAQKIMEHTNRVKKRSKKQSKKESKKQSQASLDVKNPAKKLWVCRRDGRCELFPDMDPDDVSVARVSAQFRLFQTIQAQADDKPDHVLQWGESRNDGLIVWSKFASKTRRRKGKLSFVVPVDGNTDHELRERLVRAMEKACANPEGRLHRLGYTRVIEYSNVDNEVEWHIVKARKPSTRLNSTPAAMKA